MRTVWSLSILLGLGFSSCQMSSSATGARTTPRHRPATLEEYKQELERQFGPPWYDLAKENTDVLSPGTTVVRFDIPAAGGRARNLRVISNTGGWMNELIVRRAILEFRAPIAPPAITEALHGKDISMEETFTIFENDEPTPAPKKR